MSTLKKKYNVSKLNLVRVKSQMADLSSSTLNIETVSKLEAFLTEFRKLKEIFENIADAIMMEADEDDKEHYTSIMAMCERDLRSASDYLATYEGKVKSFHKLLSIQSERESLSPPELNQSFRQPTDPNTKLDKIVVPEFSGEIVEFPSWRGMFEHLVHDTNMPNIRKLHYLKTKLTGEAGKIVRDVKLESASYPGAWQSVLNRFDNKRALIRDLFNKIEKMKPVRDRSEIRRLTDEVNSVIQALKAAGEEINDTCARMIAFRILLLLDQKTRDDFEDSFETRQTYPKWDDLHRFLQKRADTFESHSPHPPPPSASKMSETTNKQKSVEKKSFSTSKQTMKCVVCSKPHYLNHCDKFIARGPYARFETVKLNQLCIKCFSPFHGVNDCPRPNCSKCGGKHSWMLHRDDINKEANSSGNKAAGKASSSSTESSVVKTTLSTSKLENVDKMVILPSAVVYCSQKSKTGFEKITHARSLLDQGSQPNLVTEAFVKKHRLLTFKTPPIVIGGITGNAETSNVSAMLTVRSRFNSYEISIIAEVVSKIPFSINRQAILNTIRNNGELGCFAEKSIGYDDVDILIGAEFYEALVTNESKKIDGMFFRNSQFGWLISGPFIFQKPQSDSFCGLVCQDVQDQLQRFWQIEEIDAKSYENEKTEQQNCAEFVQQTLVRNKDGQFVAKLPFKRNPLELGDSYLRAEKQLRKFSTRYNAQDRESYENFMQEYLDLGHMSKIEQSFDNKKRYFIPHRAVMRPDSSTTKLRVVFNASAPTSSGLSLNDILMIGPKIQPNLLDIIMKFRKHEIVFACDVAKMYRKILVDKSDRHLQSILWQPPENNEIEKFELNTITYGTSPASFIATYCLEVLGNELESHFPAGARAIKSDFYMDDLITGEKTVEEAVELQKIIHNQLKGANFLLRKYVSNSEQFLAHIDPDLIEKSENRTFGPKDSVSLLGIQWNPTTDEFKFKIQLRADKSFLQKLTKRTLLSEISRIFDPLGILAPVTVRAKLLLQEVWFEEKGWDEPTSEKIRQSFIEYYDELECLTRLSFRRKYTQLKGVVTTKLVGFCDASERAYAAVVYICSTNELGNIDSYIVAAKTKIAPKGSFKLTIPKLELQAAELLSRLIEKVSSVLQITSIWAFSDSEVALAWLRGDINRWTVFVQNRVRKIVHVIPPQRWKYCPSKENPADLATRGIPVQKLINSKIWFHGPEFLSSGVEIEQTSQIEPDTLMKNLPEVRKNVFLSEKNIFCTHTIINKFSDLNKLIRVFAYVARFVKIIRRRELKNIRIAMSKRFTRSKKIVSFSPANVHLKSVECRASLLAIVSYIQHSHYAKEITLIKNNKPLTKSSPIFNLNPIIDNNEVIRSKSRLQNANLSFETKNLIILPAKCEFVKTMVRYVHVRYFHSTIAFIVNFVRSSYHIHGGLLNVVKQTVRECVVCKRFSVQTSQQKVGQLPSCRVNVSRPFSNVGVDLAGPFRTKCVGHRTTKIGKAYAAIFVCTAVKAVHIEVLSSLSSESFMSILNRFTSRRGVPEKILSDNATNFGGSNNFINATRSKEIHWEFITPRAPHKGGLWEAAVKSAKRHLIRSTKGYILNFEELGTIFTQIEAILNSRPLCRQSETTLTPGHFLVGSHLLLPSIVSSTAETLPIGKRYILMQSIIQSFWRAWRKDYLNELRHVAKWRNPHPNIKVGDIVVLVEDFAPPATWNLGKIEEVYPDKDGLVRVVSVKSGKSIFKRDVRKLIRLVEDGSSTGGEC